MSAPRVSRLIAATVAAVLALAAPASAATASVHVRGATLERDGSTRLIVGVTGDLAGRALGATAFTVTENGTAVDAVKAQPLFSDGQARVSVVLAMDVSGSTAGRPLADAKAAAKRFVTSLPSSVDIALVSFASTPQLRRGFTTDRGAIQRAIDGLRAGGNTSLYDAVVLGSKTFTGDVQRNLVVFSDGADTSSKASLAAATTAAERAKASVTTVGLVTQDYDKAALQALASRTGGRRLEVGNSAQLASVFAQAARDIASQYVVTYRSTTLVRELDLAVAVKVGALQASDRIAVSNPRTSDAVTDGGALGGTTAASHPLAKMVGGAIMFLALALFLTVLAGPPRNDAAALLGQLRRSSATPAGEDEDDRGTAASAMARAAELMDRMPVRRSFVDEVQLLLERAGWPLRSSEFLVLQAVGAIGGALLGFAVLGRWWLGLTLMVLGALVPRALLAQRVTARANLFMSQLPDTLELLAGSLQAGYGFMQALDTLVKESSPPTSVEFHRVLTEARLGMPVEDALTNMADRVGSEDFRWVVLAVNIQRQVGGNLAKLLQTMAATLRERDQVRRQISVLSSEGRLSAGILTVIPFLLAGYISVVNPEYIGKLFSRPIGLMMVGTAVVLMAAGIAWMRKLIRIDV